METTNRTANSQGSSQVSPAFVPQAQNHELRTTTNELRTTSHEPQTADKQLPVKKFSTGAISATISRNERTSKDGKVFETHSVNLQRRYANKNGEWMTSNSLRITDLPKAALVLEEAFKYLVLSGHGEEVAVE